MPIRCSPSGWLETGGLVMVIERLRHVDEEPIMLETSYFTQFAMPRIDRA